MTQVTAKVKVSSKSTYDDGSAALYFDADYQDPANEEWAVRTPSISVNMTVVEEVARLFERQDKVTLTFDVPDREMVDEDAS